MGSSWLRIASHSGSRARRLLVCGASATALCLGAAPAFAADEPDEADPAPVTLQDEPQDNPAAQSEDNTITVTGSRLRTNGMQAPVPVTAVAAAELSAASPGNLVEGVSQLPQFYGNQTPASPQSWFTRGGYGNLDLRGLGINRTLTLLNGRRMIPSTAFGGVDINTFPEEMIASIETVTGGASAAYGTDAVAGVVNFILDTNFTGVRVKGQIGGTSRGDSRNYEGGLSFGMALDDRGHLLVSGEIFSQDGVHSYAGRDWYQAWGTIQGADNVLRNYPSIKSSTASFDGIISAPGTAINGLAFDRNGNYGAFTQGSPAQGAIGIPGSHSSGGSGDDLAAEVQTIYPDVDRNSIFAYADYELFDNFKVFAQFIRGQNKTFRYNTPRGGLQGTPTAITIFQDNAYLPATLRQTMIDNNIASFTLRRMGSIEDIGRMALKDDSVLNSYTGGFTYDVPTDGFMGGWRMEGYFQYGTNERKWEQLGLRVDRIFAAVDAVRDGSGNIVCRTTLYSSVFSDCKPLNLFGRGNASSAAINWVVGSEPGQSITAPIYYADSGFALGESQTFTTEEAKVNRTSMRQKLAEFSASGTVWDGWAGPITAAFGAAYRSEKIQQLVEDVTNPSSDHTNGRPVRCNDPSIGLRGVSGPDCANTVGVQYSKVSNIRGKIDVSEVFGETLIPLLGKTGPIDFVNLNGAVRWADYSGSGSIWAYKGGIEISMGETIRFRGTYSRDVRAANLSERFDKTGGTATITDPKYPGDGVITVTRYSGGNPAVSPEEADTFTVGAVFTPFFIPGLSASIDYYDVDIKDAISQVGTQAVVSRCYEGATEYCSLVTRDTGTDRVILVGDVFVNVAQARVRGIDLEIGYRSNSRLFAGNNENFSTRLFASWLKENSQVNSNGVKIDRVGQTGIQQSDGVAYALPRFKATGNFTYNIDGLSLFFQGRYIGSGTVENQALANNVKIGSNHVDSVFYADFQMTYRTNLGIGGAWIEGFAQITNVFDKDPPITPYYSAFLGYTIQTNPLMYDILGRRFTLGAKIGF